MDGKIVVIDTNIIIDHDKKKSCSLIKYFEKQKNKEVELVISTITIFEYYSSKLLENPDYKKETDSIFSFFKIQEVNTQIAKIAAELNRKYNLYQKVGANDILIASTCLYLNAYLLTKNKKHFRLIPGIKII